MSRKRLRRWKRLFERVAGRRCSLRCDRCCLYGGLSGGGFVCCVVVVIVVVVTVRFCCIDGRILSPRFPIFSPFFLSPRLFFPSSFSPFPSLPSCYSSSITLFHSFSFLTDILPSLPLPLALSFLPFLPLPLALSPSPYFLSTSPS